MNEADRPTPAYPETHGSPSLQAAECRSQHPRRASGSLGGGSEAEPLHAPSGGAGGELPQGTTDGRQGATDAADAAPGGGGRPFLVLEGRLEPTPTGGQGPLPWASDRARSGPPPTARGGGPTTPADVADGPGADAWTLRDDACPLEGYSAVDHTTGEIAWSATCGSARCYRCSRMVSARSFALARRAMQDLDGRVRFVTLTLAPEEWQDVRHRMKMLVRHLRRRGVRVNWLWVVEEGEQTGMKHIHAVQWGDFIPWRDLLAAWGARVQIEAADAAIGYLGKNVIRYLGKGLDGDREAIEHHMNLNGGRAAHWTRGFYAGHSRESFAQEHPLPGIYFLRNELIGAPS